MSSEFASPEISKSTMVTIVTCIATLVAAAPVLISLLALLSTEHDTLATLRHEHGRDAVQIFTRSLVVGGGSAAIGFPAAVLMTRIVPSRALPWLLAFLSLPFLVSELIRTFAWTRVLGIYGYVNTTLLASGLINKPIEWLMMSEFAVTLAIMSAAIPVAILLLTLHLQTFPRTTIESAVELGASPLSIFVELLVPLSYRALAASAVCCAALSFSNASAVHFLGGPSQVSFRSITMNFESAGRVDAVLVLGLALSFMSALLGVFAARLISK